MGVYLICYAASYLFARAGYYWLSGLVLILAALWLYWYDYRRTENIIHLRGLFSLFWVGGQGIACLKLSELSSDWNIVTWLCFLAALLGFWVTYEFLMRAQGESGGQRSRWFNFQGYERPLFWSMVIVTAVSLGAFLAEALILGFVPFFVRGVPHAYSTFHITGVHYFTVSCVLVPALSVLYFCIEQGRNGVRMVLVILMDILACAIPVLCVSRFQLILAVGLAVLTYIAMDNRLKISYEYTTYECDEFTDGVQVADKLGYPHELVYKTLVTIGKSGGYYVFVIPIEAEIDFKKAARTVKEKSLEMLHLKDLTKVTGYIRGGCTAIGMKKQFPTVIQESAKELEQIHISGGRLGMQLKLSPFDLQKAANAEFADVIRRD